MHSNLPHSFASALALLVTCVAAWLPLIAAAEDPAADSAAIVIRNTTLIDGTGADPLPGVDVLVRGERIAEIGADLEVGEGTRILDGAGKFVVPGLIDTHVHLQFPIVFQLSPEERQIVVDHTPKAFLYNGVTTVLNVSAPNDWILERRDAQRAGRLVGPTIYALGESFKPVDGWGSRHGGASTDAVDARAMALSHIAEGVDGFKIIIEDGPGSQGTHVEMPEEMLQAIVDVAREHGMPIYSHSINLHEYHRAADIDSTAIIHGLKDPIPPGDDLIDKLLANGLIVTPTLSLFESFLQPDPWEGHRGVSPFSALLSEQQAPGKRLAAPCAVGRCGLPPQKEAARSNPAASVVDRDRGCDFGR